MIRMKDMAARLHLSTTTVSYVLSGEHVRHRIAAGTVRRVRGMAEKLGYRRSALACALKAQRSNLVALVVGDLGNPFWSGVAVGAQREAEKRGYTLLVFSTQDELERERRTVTMLQERFVDGLILSPSRLEEGYLARIRKEGRPFILIDRTLRNLEVPCVRTDSLAGSEMAVDHLARRGHRSIAFVGGPERISTFRERLGGFVKAMERRRLSPVVVTTEGDARSTVAGVRKILGRSPRPTALYTANLLITLGALQAVQASGLRAPQDLEIVGFDEIPTAGLLRFPVTTVAQDVDAMGREAVNLLLKVMKGEKGAREVLLRPRLIVR